MGLFDFTSLKKGLSEFTSSLRDTSKRIEALKREREDIEAAPIGRDDIRAYFLKIIESRGQSHLDAIARHVAPLRAKNLQRLDDPQHVQYAGVLSISTVGSPSATPQSLEAALCLLLKPQLTEAIGRIVDGLDLPSNAMPIAERARRLEQIDAALDVLVAEELALVATARGAGILVSPGPHDSEKLHGR